jgi:OOP family OmpA-OmpF porin
MFLPRSPGRSIIDTAAPLVPGLWSRPFMEPIPFAPGQAELSVEAAELLDEMAIALSWFVTSCTLEIAGHAWEEGDLAELRAISQLRAERVREALVERGLPAWLIRVRGYGAGRPAPTGCEDEPARSSRRVEIWLHQPTPERGLPCADPGGDGCCRAC